MTVLLPSSVELRSVINGSATPMIVTESARAFRGAIYDQNGHLVTESQRVKSPRNEWNPDDPFELPPQDNLRNIPGRSLYLGHYTGHYGHFLIETLSRAWALLEPSQKVQPYDHYVFHPFLHKTPNPLKFSPARISFKCLGLELEKVVVLKEPARFDHIDVPRPYFNINDSVNPAMAKVYGHIQSCASGLETSGVGLINKWLGWPETGRLKIYISRRKARGYHPMLNEQEVEKLFLAFGFRIFHPEKWSFEQQVSIFSRSDVIAGVEGSALHNSVFMCKGSTVISIGTPRVTTGQILNQDLCNSLSGVENRLISFQGVVDRKNRAVYDINHIRNQLVRFGFSG